MSQLPLPMAWTRRGGPESLIIHATNAEAVALVRDWRRWPSLCTILVGPARSGRSLIGQAFAAQSGGLIVDDADRDDEQRLFNIWNESRDTGRPLLLIAQDAPPIWAITLPDLRTRLATAAIARIAPPDEAVTAALIAHGLEQAGSAFAPDVPEFLARRTERCYADIDAMIAELNALSLASTQKLSVGMIRHTLRNNVNLDKSAADNSPEGID